MLQTRLNTPIVQYLFRKQPVRGKWIYLGASVLFGLVALAGYEYGAAPLYSVPAILCVVQFLHPNIFLWALLLALFVAADLGYLYAIIQDIVRVTSGRHPSLFVDVDDSVLFTALILVMLGITIGLFVWRPGLRKQEHKQEQHNQAL